MPDSRQFSTFFLGDLHFGIEVEKVQEIIRYQHMTRVPLASSVVHGLINLRGQIVTAIDLRERLRVLAPASELDDLSTRRPASLLQGLGPWDAAQRGPEVERWLGEAA